MHKATLGWALFLSMILTVMHVGAQDVKPPGETQSLVIIGASYAADWKQPELPGYRVVNTGIGGQETHEVRARFERDALASRPDAVLIWGHINNIHRAAPGSMKEVREKVQADYVDMVSRARASNVDVILATEVTLSEAVGFMNRVAAFVGRLQGKQSYKTYVNTEVRALNDWLRSYAQRERLRLLDFEKVFDDGEGFRKVEYSQDDGSHISPEGYAALTAYTRTQLR